MCYEIFVIVNFACKIKGAATTSLPKIAKPYCYNKLTEKGINCSAS
jgi:hypothetical protein